MMNVKEIDLDQINDYIRQECAKGRGMDEIVKELVENCDDVILLFHDHKVGEQQLGEMAERLTRSSAT